MFKKLLKKKKEEERDPLLSFELEYKKHKFYVFNSFDYSYYGRFQQFILALHETDLRIAETDLDKCEDLIIGHINTANLHGISQVVQKQAEFRNQYAYEKNLFKLANAMIVLDEEPLKVLEEKWTRKKAELFEESLEVRAFFLSIAFTLKERIQNWLTNSKYEAILKKDRPGRIREEEFSKLIGFNTFTDYLSG